MLDLPDPLGPTITLTPGEKVSRVRSGNDLNPFRLIAFRYIGVPRVAGVGRVAGVPEVGSVARRSDAIALSALEVLQSAPGGRLLGLLLAPPGAAADLIATD